MTIRDKLVLKMETDGVSYRELARRIGTSPENVWDKLNKRAKPGFMNIYKIADALGCEMRIIKQDGTDADFNDALFFETADMEQVSYDCIECLLAALGYELIFSHL